METWQAMIELLREGRTRAIGVSNFSLEDITPLVERHRDRPLGRPGGVQPHIVTTSISSPPAPGPASGWRPTAP